VSIQKRWIVYNPAKGKPTVTHPSYLIAKMEAERLARFNPGEDFFVYECVGRAKAVNVVYEDAVQEMPF
jgi:hypothetical protein